MSKLFLYFLEKKDPKHRETSKPKKNLKGRRKKGKKVEDNKKSSERTQISRKD